MGSPSRNPQDSLREPFGRVPPFPQKADSRESAFSLVIDFFPLLLYFEDMDPLLFGHNKEERIVAVQALTESTVRIYKRIGTGIIHKDAEFFPFFHISA